MKKAQSEILFGSATRGDADELSDRDILIIDANHHTLRERKNYLLSQGYSVGAYTWNRFNKLYEKKSLFIQHLKLEGKILEDQKGKLQKSLCDFHPKTSYQDEIKENKKLFDLLKAYPDTATGHLWAADLLYVALRNYGVLLLASRSEYVFGFETIIEKLSQHGLINKKDFSKFIGLRFLKSLYRSENVGTKSTITGRVNEIIEALNPIYPDSIMAVCPHEAFEEMVSNMDMTCPYHCLRNIEKNYIIVTSLYPELKTQRQFKEILGLIKDPRSYAFLAAKNQDQISKLFLSYSPEKLFGTSIINRV